MNKVIQKFPLGTKDPVILDIPKGAQLLSIRFQDGQICLWAAVDPSAELEQITFEVYHTGDPISADLNYRVFMGTVSGEIYTWHIFKVMNEAEINQHNYQLISRHLL